MKTTIVLLTLVCLGCAAPKEKKNFQDYFEEFLAISEALEGAHLGRQTGNYMGFDTFRAGLNAIDAPIKYQQLAKDLESVPEYKALTDFLKNLTIDVNYYVKRYEDYVSRVNSFNPDSSKSGQHSRQRRHPITGSTLDTSIVDTVSMLPRRQLRQLFHEKMAHDEFFRSVIEAIKSDRFKQLYNALWANRTFRSVANALEDNALSLKYLFEELLPAFFGQNTPLYVSFQMQFDEFLDIIIALEGDYFVRQVVLAYSVFPEFLEALNYVNNISLINLYQQVVSQADIRPVDGYLRRNDLFIAYYIDRFQLLVKYFVEDLLADQIKEVQSHDKHTRQRRHPITGRTLYTCIVDTVSLMPRKQLRQLYDYKYATDKVFKSTIEALKSEEWQQFYKKLWEDKKFNEIVSTLAEHDLDVKYLFEELGPALFGQNTPIYFSFQNQFDEFLDIIVQSEGDNFVSLVESYMNFPEFRNSLEFLDKVDLLDYYKTFAQTVPAFITVDRYLKGKDIFVAYYMDRLKLVSGYINSNVTFDGFGEAAYTNTRVVSVSGTTMRSFMEDVAKLFPKTKLDALYQEKLAENKEFLTAIEGLRANEWNELYETLWRDETFKELADQFSENDFDLRYVIEKFVPTLWGQ
ncbi:uncharacterized protein LOC123716192 [Pieris brassicae]|uniref:uncharacterized protein LOC123716192 n=1 Tax=Pieris brassicae TaxID=7116 RepID=UPI001E662731|nr:uncharacterized protein LOC123716192 [Pieris brassicae]